MLDSTTRTTRPFTGAGYLESLRDRREVSVYGSGSGPAARPASAAALPTMNVRR